MKLSVVILPSRRWREASEIWRRADQLELHAGYTYDHLSWRSFRERPWFTMIPTLSAAAGVTSRLRLGPLVATPNFRHPLLLAKDLLALDDISNGRVTVGVGSGGTGFDATVLGLEQWSAKERHERFVEFTSALDRLLREPASTIEGEFYRVLDSRQLPGPVQLPRPPLVVSALGPQGLAYAASVADGWISVGAPAGSKAGSTFEAVAGQVKVLEDELARHRRDSSTFQRMILDFASDEQPLGSFESFVDWAGRYRELGFTEAVVHWPTPDSPFDYDPALFERVATEGALLLARP